MNRIRVQVGLENGKVSEASDSVFVTVEAMEEDQGVTFFSILFIIALIGVFGWMMSSTIGD
jgi:flagellar biogenesis protein FliO